MAALSGSCLRILQRREFCYFDGIPSRLKTFGWRKIDCINPHSLVALRRRRHFLLRATTYVTLSLLTIQSLSLCLLPYDYLFPYNHILSHTIQHPTSLKQAPLSASYNIHIFFPRRIPPCRAPNPSSTTRPTTSNRRQKPTIASHTATRGCFQQLRRQSLKDKIKAKAEAKRLAAVKSQPSRMLPPQQSHVENLWLFD